MATRSLEVSTPTLRRLWVHHPIATAAIAGVNAPPMNPGRHVLWTCDALTFALGMIRGESRLDRFQSALQYLRFPTLARKIGFEGSYFLRSIINGLSCRHCSGYRRRLHFLQISLKLQNADSFLLELRPCRGRSLNNLVSNQSGLLVDRGKLG